MPSVKSALGLKKKPKESAPTKARRAAGAAGQKQVVNAKELEQQLATLETVTKKLVKSHKTGNQDSQDAAFQVKTAAERIRGNLPHPMTLGPQYEPSVKRLQRIEEQMQLIWDEHLTAGVRRKAEEIYLKSGRDALTTQGGHEKQQGPRNEGAFHALGYQAQNAFVDKEQGEAGHDQQQQLLAAAKDLGLSRAEAAAIYTFTSEDYLYINPATANSASWMLNANKAADHVDTPNRTPEQEAEMDKMLIDSGVTYWKRLRERHDELSTKRQEGGLHAAMALQGLLKLKPWPPGTLYRGEVLALSDFEARFKPAGKGTYKPVEKSWTKTTISSMSRDRKKSSDFWVIAGSKVKDPKKRIMWEVHVTNGRDIERLSANEGEKEVATLPGAEFRITSVETQRGVGGMEVCIVVKAKQVK